MFSVSRGSGMPWDVHTGSIFVMDNGLIFNSSRYIPVKLGAVLGALRSLKRCKGFPGCLGMTCNMEMPGKGSGNPCPSKSYVRQCVSQVLMSC